VHQIKAWPKGRRLRYLCQRYFSVSFAKRKDFDVHEILDCVDMAEDRRGDVEAVQIRDPPFTSRQTSGCIKLAETTYSI